MKKFLPIFIVVFIIVIIGAAGFNFVRDKQAAKEPFGGSFNLVTMDGKPFSEKICARRPQSSSSASPIVRTSARQPSTSLMAG